MSIFLDYTLHKMILGTHTTDEQNHLLIANVKIPTEEAVLDLNAQDAAMANYGYFGPIQGRLEVVHKINHEGEVNRARFVTCHRQYLHMFFFSYFNGASF